MLTKKHFKELARIIGEQYAAEALNSSYPLLTEITLMCRKDNSRFDISAFQSAVIASQTQAIERRRNAKT